METPVIEQEVNNDQIRQELLAEKKGSDVGGKKPWEIRLEQDHPEMVDIKKKEEPKEVVEEEDLQEAPQEESQSEEQPAKTKSAPVEEQPEEEAQPVETRKDTAKEEDAYIAEYAKKGNLTVDQAKEEVTSLRAISAKYGNDPVKIAKAYREVQSAYDKQKVTASSNVNPAVAAIAANPRSYVIGEVSKNAEKLIAEFRQQNPARSRDMDDEQVTEEIVERGTIAVKNQIGSYEVQLKRDALSKRDELVKTINEADKRYLPEIKPVLDNLPDWQVVGKDFRFEDLVSWAKGKSVDRLVKEAEDRVHKQYANKDRKIVGEISKSPQTTKVKQAVETSSKGSSLSKWDKDQARQMYSSANMSEDEMFDAYIELKNRKKK